MSKLKVQHVDTRHPRGTLFIGHDGSTTHFHPHSRVILHEYATQDWVKKYIADELDLDIDQLLTKSEAYDTFPAIHISRVEPVDENVHLNDFWICTNPDAKATHVCTGIERDQDGVVTKYHWRKFVPSPDLDEDVDIIKTEIVELQGELEAVIRTAEKGSWNTKVGDPAVDPINNGEVMFSNVNFTTPTLTVKMSVNDADGKTHSFDGVNIGQTYIEFIEDDEDYLLFKPASINLDEPGLVIMEGTSEIGKGVTQDGSKIEVRAFEANAEVDVSSLMPKSGGEFTGDVTWNASDIIFKPFSPDHLWMNLQSNMPKNADGQTLGGTPWGFKVDIGAGNTYRNQFKVANGDTDLFTVKGGGSGKIELAREAHYTTNPKSTYADKEIPHWKGVKDWVDKIYQQKGNYGLATEKLGNGYSNFYNFVYPASLGDRQFSLSSANATGASYAYFYRLYDYYNRLVKVKDFYRTPNSMLEIWEQSTGDVVLRVGIREYGTSSYSSSDVYLELHRIWAKPSYSFSTSKLYCILLTHMIRK